MVIPSVTVMAKRASSAADLCRPLAAAARHRYASPHYGLLRLQRQVLGELLERYSEDWSKIEKLHYCNTQCLYLDLIRVAPSG